MLNKIFAGHHATLPKSPTSIRINLIATVILICGFAAIRLYKIPDVEAAVLALAALALPIIVLEYIFLKTYKRASTGLNLKIKNLPDIRRIAIKILGLYGTIGFVALIYWLFRIYRTNFYNDYWIFIQYVALILLIGGIPYFIILDRYLVEPRDSYWHFGMAMLGQWKEVDGKTFRQHILGWVVKLFFLPLMFCFLIGNLGYIRATSFSAAVSFFPSLYNYFYNFIFTIDLTFAGLGYLMTMQIFDSQVRTADPTIFGWIVALQCYPPFWNFSYGNYLHYDNGLYWGDLWANNHVMYLIWGVTILVLLLIYVSATITFGIRFSNLTNRGILTNGPYRFCMHPAYVSKNLSWWLISVPFISQASPWDAIRQSLLLFILNIIYYLRAITEERHLSQDPNYVKYGLAMNERSVFRGLHRILPFLKYNPEKYLRQLDDYSRFTVPGTIKAAGDDA